MSLLEVNNLSHMFADKVLYKNASFALFKGEHMGVVGQNGAGKSTLIKILTGEVIPDAGEIKWQPNSRIGNLNQYAEVDGVYTVIAYLRTAFAGLYALEEQISALYLQAAETGEEEILLKAAGLQEELERSDFYAVDSEIHKLVTGLGIEAFGVETPLEELSGGQRSKVILAKLLLEKAEVLLLDEPTNFLDKEHISWLSEYLTTFPGAFIVVSHDADFLEKISDCVCDIEFDTIQKYHGKFSDFLTQKGRLREDYIRQYSAQQKKIEQTEAFIRKNKAGVNSKMARGRQKQLDRMEKIAPPSFTAKPVIHFDALPVSSQVALHVHDLAVGYQYALLPKLNFSVGGAQKLVITGFNGIGKSTLLKTLVGAISAISGGFHFAESIKIDYYEQDLQWKDPAMTPIQIIAEDFPKLTEKQIRKQLAQCGVKVDSVLQTIHTLSGGEQSKVKLCKLLLSPCNCLILDEPTNHLDADTKEALQAALTTFDGCVILVSHEERFYRGWADKVLSIEEYL